MILVDTSIWVAHLKTQGGHAALVDALEKGVAATHPLVEGELLLAGAPVDVLLSGLVRLPESPHTEVLEFIAGRPRPVRRVGWVDAHLVHAALVHHCELLTRDGPLSELFRSCRAARGS